MTPLEMFDTLTPEDQAHVNDLVLTLWRAERSARPPSPDPQEKADNTAE